MGKIAIMGHGTVGSGVAEVLMMNQQKIAASAGEPVEIKYILDLRDFPDLPYADKMIRDFSLIENDPEISVVVETMGGLKPAYPFVRACLMAGKSVVTSNKQLVATHGSELLAIAKQKNVNFLFEASVCGGIPVIKTLHQCLAANRIEELRGIFNGTTNFILTRMAQEGMSFEEALSLAQTLGYAEKDPSADVDGQDACWKLSILSSLAFGSRIPAEKIPTEGIRKITREDILCAEKWGGAVKLVARARQLENGQISVMVSPAMVPFGSQLSHVDDVFNAAMFTGNAVGDVMFYGRGAGKLATASAVVSDVIDAVREKSTVLTLTWADERENSVAPAQNAPVKAYLRLVRGAATLEKVQALFGAEQITVLPTPEWKDALVLFTGEMTESTLAAGLAALMENDETVLSMIRVLD